MASNLSLVFSPKRDVLYQSALAAVDRLTQRIAKESKCISVDQNVWAEMVEGNPRSPKIMGIGQDGKYNYIIFYPKHSAAYVFEGDELCTYVEVLSGEITDRFTNKKYTQGQKIVFNPYEKLMPVTTTSEAYVRVCKGKEGLSFDEVCK